MNLIQPRVLKGFHDALPSEEILRSTLIEKFTKIYRSYGFVPIDTPILEYTDILLRKSNGETEKQVFRFNDNGGRDVSMRFDLTVPFARFIAQHKDQIYFPFKRYHIAKVWRGEKPQAGRYREFVQCDFDIVGSDSEISDFEILSLIKSSLESIDIKEFTININHRGLFNRFLKHIDCYDKSEDILRLVDKIQKIDMDELDSELFSILNSHDKVDLIFDYITPKEDFLSTLNHLETLAGGPGDDSQRLKDIYNIICSMGMSSYFSLNPSITRGLDYYTGIVYETFLNKLTSIGSICSGGRYDNLAGLYMKDNVSGVGASIGIDRLLSGMEQLNIANKKDSYLDVEIFNTGKDFYLTYQKLAMDLRNSNISAEIFPDNKKLIQQYEMADKKGIKWGILFSKNSANEVKPVLKNLKTREEKVCLSTEEIICTIVKGDINGL